MAIKLLIGGSPCTHWSIAQKNNRETTAEGIGWELFKNYLIAKEKFKPDFFLYENNKSAAQPIKDQIAQELGVGSDPQARFTYINSALVSAQNRQRFYVTNFGDIEQPEDRGILLRDVLEGGEDLSQNEKGYCLTATYNGACACNTIERSQRSMVAEPVACRVRGRKDSNGDGYARYECRNDLKSNTLDTNTTNGSMVAEPVGTTNGGKSFALTAYYSTGQNAPNTLTKSKGSMVAEPVCVAERGRYENGVIQQHFEAREDGKTNTLTRVSKDNNVAEPIRVGDLPNEKGEISGSQATRIYDIDGKSVCLQAGAGGQGARTGLYAIPVPYQCAELSNEYYHGDEDGQLFGKIECDNSSNNKGQPAQGTRIYCTDCKSICLDGDSRKYIIDTLAIPTEFNKDVPIKAVSCADGKTYPVYQVLNGQITIKNKQYPIKLQDGYYIIRKLTVTECCRLQTMPDDYCKAVSAAQGYKGLGNGWTAEVIIHLLNHALKDIPKDEEIVVLSMYDGIGTGRYCLDKMGFTNIKYHAYEIDKYPMAIANDNYPDIVQHGDAFAVREDSWKPPQTRSEWLDSLLGVR